MAISFIEHYRAIRRTSTPLVTVRTADPASTMRAIVMDPTSLPVAADPKNGIKATEGVPILLWDRMQGLIGVNASGANLMRMLIKALGKKPETLTNPADMLAFAAGQFPPKQEGQPPIDYLPEGTVLFMANVNRYFKEFSVVQGLWNLRDKFKQNTRTLIITCPDITLPSELASDMVILDEPLPDSAQLEAIVKETYSAVGQKEPDAQTISLAVDALCGIAAFPAEQRCAMSIHKAGLDMEELWEGKRQAISQTPGLSISRSTVKFDQVTGLENAKAYHLRRKEGPPELRRRCVVFIDEGDKHLGGFGAVGTGDTTTEMVGFLLTDMEENEAEGTLFLGIPGSGKTLLASAIANDWGVPQIVFDLSGMKGSLVGQSGENIRNALKVVRAVSQGNPYYIMTVNRLENIPPELRRRFRNASFFFDYPNKVEREACWNLYEKKYGIMPQFKTERPPDKGWTGAEIRNCCYNAKILSCSLLDAARYVNPVSISAKKQMDELRDYANGKFTSATYPGLFTIPEGDMIEEAESPTIVFAGIVPPKRKITTGGMPSGGSKGAN